MTAVVVLVVVVVTAVAAHELAHVAATRAVGHDIFEIQIGTGPEWRTRIGAVDVGIGLLPLGGHVQTGSRDADGYRWRAAVIAVSGVAANLALAGFGTVLGSAPMVGFNAVAVVANLWPGRRQRTGEPSSDGRVLLDLVRGDADAIAEERSGWFCVQAMRAREDGRLDDARRLVEAGEAMVGPTRALLAVAGVLAFEQRRFDDVVAAYAPLIDHPEVAVPARAGFAADAAWAASLSDDPRLRALAHPWAAFAHRLRPRLARRRMILALAQVDAGAPGDALATLGDLDDPSADAVRVLALAAAGDAAGAREHFDHRVRERLDPDHPLRQRAASAVL